MANRNNVRWTKKSPSRWRVIKDNKRHLPCHPAVLVRVKVLEPGVQSRWCDRCQTWRYFALEELVPGTWRLRLRWLTDQEAEDHERQTKEGIVKGVTCEDGLD